MLLIILGFTHLRLGLVLLRSVDRNIPTTPVNSVESSHLQAPKYLEDSL